MEGQTACSPLELCFPDGTLFRGEVVDNELTGTGSLTWMDGSSYTGGLRGGLREGVGEFAAPGLRFTGEFVRGHKHGRGRLAHASGSVYEGQFAHGRREGQGAARGPRGSLYLGGFARDQREGFGRAYWPGGERYKGEWAGGARCGLGSYTWPGEGRPFANRFVGWWARDHRHGPGLWLYANDDFYLGSWRNDLKHGPGLYVDHLGRARLLNFCNDVQLALPPQHAGPALAGLLEGVLAGEGGQEPRLAESSTKQSLLQSAPAVPDEIGGTGALINLSLYAPFWPDCAHPFASFAADVHCLLLRHHTQLTEAFRALRIAQAAKPSQTGVTLAKLDLLRSGGRRLSPQSALALRALFELRGSGRLERTLRADAHLRLLLEVRRADADCPEDAICTALSAHASSRWTPPPLDYAHWSVSLERTEDSHAEFKRASRGQLASSLATLKRLGPKTPAVHLSFAGFASALFALAVLTADFDLFAARQLLAGWLQGGLCAAPTVQAESNYYVQLRVERSLSRVFYPAWAAPHLPNPALRALPPLTRSALSGSGSRLSGEGLRASSLLASRSGELTVGRRDAQPPSRPAKHLLQGEDFVARAGDVLAALLTSGAVGNAEEFWAFMAVLQRDHSQAMRVEPFALSLRASDGGETADLRPLRVPLSALLHRAELQQLLTGYFCWLGPSGETRLARLTRGLAPRAPRPPRKC